MPNHTLKRELAEEAALAYQLHGSEPKAAAALGISRSTLQTRLRRARQMCAKDTTTLHEQRFVEMDIDLGTVLVCSDVHCWPGEFTDGQAAFIWFAHHLRPNVIVINGDLFDGSGISRHPSVNWNRTPTVKQEIEACQKFTDALRLASPGSKKIIVPGNHDERFARKLVSYVPEYAGIPGFDLREHFPEWQWAYRLTINNDSEGMTDIVHNWANGVHAAWNNAGRSGINYLTGHTHRLLIRPFADRRGMRYGVETGTLAGQGHPSSYYVAGRPTDWHPGFVLLTYHNGLLLRPEQIDVLPDGGVSFRGTVSEIPQVPSCDPSPFS